MPSRGLITAARQGTRERDFSGECSAASKSRAAGASTNAKHISWGKNTLADGISHWTRAELVEIIWGLTNSDDWVKQPFAPRGGNIFDVVLQTKNMGNRHDYTLWNITSNDRDPVGFTFACVPSGTLFAPPGFPSLPPRGLFNTKLGPTQRSRRRRWWRRSRSRQ